jgi:MFS family permease
MFIHPRKVKVSTRTSWRLLIAENLITTRLVTPIMVAFCLSIGLNLSEVGVADVASSVAYLALNIPIGWVADRLSRKICNLLGNIIYGISMVAFGLSTSPSGVIAAYVMMALGISCTHGADVALLEAHCDKLGINYEDVSKRLSQAAYCTHILAFTCCAVLVAHFGMKTTILIASVPFFIGAILSCFIQEIGTLKKAASSEFKEMVRVIWYASVKNRQLSWLLIAYTTGVGMTSAITILVGPMLLAVGGQESHIALVYTVLVIMALVGGEVSRRAFKTKGLFKPFVLACTAALVPMSVLSLHLSVLTAGLFLIVHMVRGWMSTTLPPLIQKVAPQEVKATISSLAGTLEQGAFMIAVVAVALASDYGISWGFAINVVLFAPFAVIAAWGLRRTASVKEQEDYATQRV